MFCSHRGKYLSAVHDFPVFLNWKKSSDFFHAICFEWINLSFKKFFPYLKSSHRSVFSPVVTFPSFSIGKRENPIPHFFLLFFMGLHISKWCRSRRKGACNHSSRCIFLMACGTTLRKDLVCMMLVVKVYMCDWMEQRILQAQYSYVQ